MSIFTKKILLALIVFSFFISKSVQAKHIFGADLSYKNISGNIYQVTLTLYGDCSGTPSFSNLFSAIPELQVLNGNSLYATYDMQPIGTPGLEVTPVCPAQLSNTNCNGGTIPGIARFEFRTNITLPFTSTNWRFVFDGNLGSAGGSAGRSTLITNILQNGQGSSVMRLMATLNNAFASGVINNSAEYTTIPTPFFCINLPQQYNQGAIDADGDILTYDMVAGLETGGANVTYLSPFTETDPMSVQAGSWVFNGNSGQMNFTPNMVSNNLVVTQVTETRNGVVVGTTMREMVFVIQNNCTNQSPVGTISNTNAGTLNANGTEITLCEGPNNNIQFTIQGFDPDLQNINVSVNGLPAAITTNVLNNNTPNPSIQVVFTPPLPFTVGDYTFFITYTDDGCPLSSKQTIAYTVHLVNPFTTATANVMPETCTPGNDAVIVANANSTNGSGLQYSINAGTSQSSGLFSNLTAGTYTIKVIDSKGCVAFIPVNIPPSVKPIIDSIEVDDISCNGELDGSIQVQVTATTACTYAMLPGGLTNNTGYFNNLSANTYTVFVTDANNCSSSETATIVNPPPIGFVQVDIRNLFCEKQNGKIVASSNLTNGIYYFLKPGIGMSADGIFENLPANTYTLSVRNENGCSHDTVVTVGVTPNDFSAFTTQTDLPCQGSGREGSAEVFASGGQAPYSYLWTSKEISPSSDSRITNLYYGWYFVTTTDAVGCETKDTVYIKPGNCCENIFAPDVFTPNGDGLNDTWHIITSTGIQVEHFKVYNRWGQKVWDAEDQRASWDGRQKNRIVDNGVYYYMLKYKCLTDDKMYLKKGEINVIN